MKKIFNLLLVISMITNSCTKNDSVTTKIYGEGKDRMKSSSARVDIAAYTDFEKLYDRLEEIACNDSIPSIAIQKRDTVKVIHLLNPCWEDHACILVKERNILKILNDSIFKANKSYSINQMTKVLKKDYNNFGKVFFKKSVHSPATDLFFRGNYRKKIFSNGCLLKGNKSNYENR